MELYFILLITGYIQHQIGEICTTYLKVSNPSFEPLTK